MSEFEDRLKALINRQPALHILMAKLNEVFVRQTVEDRKKIEALATEKLLPILETVNKFSDQSGQITTATTLQRRGPQTQICLTWPSQPDHYKELSLILCWDLTIQIIPAIEKEHEEISLKNPNWRNKIEENILWLLENGSIEHRHGHPSSNPEDYPL